METEEETAWHESGHALIAHYLGITVHSVTVDPDWDDGPKRTGDTQLAWDSDGQTALEFHGKRVMVALAGPVAEMHYTGEPYHPGAVAEWGGDWAEACDAVRHLFNRRDQQLAFLEATTAELYHLLNQEEFRAALGDLADNLLAHETLEGEQVEEIISQWLS